MTLGFWLRLTCCGGGDERRSVPIGSLGCLDGLRVDCRGTLGGLVLTEPVAGRWEEQAGGEPIGSLCDRVMVEIHVCRNPTVL